MNEQFKQFYRRKMWEVDNLSEAKNYAKAAGTELDVKYWITEKYLRGACND